MRDEYHELTPREQRDLYKVQLRDAQTNNDTNYIKDLKEKIEDVEFHILKFGNTWE